MIFIDSLIALGYSAINLALVFAVIAFLGFVSLRSWLKSPLPGYIFLAVLTAAFVWTTIYFAQINAAMISERDKKRATETEQSEPEQPAPPSN